MNNFNFDENSVNKLKDMLNKGDLNNILSQIPPDMIKNVSEMMGNQQNTNNTQNPQNSQNKNNFDFNNIDINTIMKMKSVMEKLNDSNDPRANLLYSLKPYVRESKKNKIDQYANLLNIAKIADLFKNDNKENDMNGPV